MKNQILKYLVLLGFGFYLNGCSSGPYDLDQTDVQQEEKTVTADTTRSGADRSSRRSSDSK